MKARLYKTLLSVLILFSVSSGVIAGTYQPADKHKEQKKEELRQSIVKYANYCAYVAEDRKGGFTALLKEDRKRQEECRDSLFARIDSL